MQKPTIILLCFIFVPYIVSGKLLRMELSEAIKSKMVVVDGVNNGSYKGKSTRLSISNTTESTLQLNVNLGIILKPESPDYQPLVLSGEEMIVIQPSKTGTIDVNTFCGNSPKAGPSSGLHYSFLKVGSDTLIQVLRFIKTNSLFDHLGQDAVWAITNGHEIGSVYDGGREEIAGRLRALLCKVTGRANPEYFSVTSHNNTPNEPAYTPKALKIIANFEILLAESKTLTLGVYDSAGRIIQPVFEDQTFQRAGHRFGVEFESADVAAGKYYIRLKEGVNVLQEKMVMVY